VAAGAGERGVGSPWARDVAILTGATAVLYGVLCWHPMLGSYPRYVLSAKEMVRDGDWIVPHLSYVPYLEKPILLYWFAAACRLLLGTSRAAVLLPSGLAALGSVLLTYAFGRALRSPGFGLAAGLMLLLSAQFLVMSTMLTTDPLFSSWVLLAAFAYWRHRSARGRGWVWIFWVAVALGWLTKGPLAMVFAALSIGGYLALEGGWRGLWRGAWALRPVSGLLVVALVNLPWHWLVWQRDPRFLEMFYLRINLGGFYDESVNHPGPFWYYVPAVLVAFLPWSFVGAAALGIQVGRSVGRAVRERASALQSSRSPSSRAEVRPDLRLFLTSTVLFPFLFLSLSASKLDTYILPLVPSMMLLAADALWARADAPPAWMRWGSAVQAAVLTTLVVLALCFFRERLGIESISKPGWSLLVASLVLWLGGMFLCAVEASRGRVLRGMALAGVSGALALAVLLPNVERISPDIYAGRLARELRLRAGPEDRIVLSHKCVQDYTIVLELDRRPGILDETRELSMGHFTEVTPRERPLPRDIHDVSALNLPENPWLYSWPRLTAEWRGKERVWLFCSEKEAERLRAEGLTGHELGRSQKIVLLTNQALPAPGKPEVGG
jgi:4-amino-4-deoxy-L-arabinose transferase-like glycosyltransferase